MTSVVLAGALWRRWLGGWGGDVWKGWKFLVLLLLSALLCRNNILVTPFLFIALACWFLIQGDNGKWHIFRYGVPGIGYLILKPLAKWIPAIPWLGITKGGWTEVGELWLGGTTLAILEWSINA